MQVKRLFCGFLWMFVLLSTANAGGLPQALQSTMAKHPAIAARLDELSAQGFQIDSAKAGRFPTLSAGLGVDDKGDNSGSLNVRQPLYAFGKIVTPIALEEARLTAEQAGLLQLQRSFLDATATAYVQVQNAWQCLQVSEESVTEYIRLYQRIERRRLGQLATAADSQIAYSRLSQARSDKERFASELAIAQAELESLTRQTTDTAEAVPQQLTTLPDEQQLLAQADTGHADILYQQALIKLAEITSKQEKIASTPTLYADLEQDLFDSAEEESTRISINFEGALDGAGLNMLGRIRSANAKVLAARKQLAAARTSVKLEISSLLTNLKYQTQLQEARQESVKAVEKTRESYLRQYDNGRKTWLEVLNIQRELTDQQLQLIQAGHDRLIIALRLAALLGQLDQVAGLEGQALSLVEEGA